jgi:hypothetical protein
MQRKQGHQNSLPLDNNSHSSFRNTKIWSHVELGAANYGENVHADSSHISNGKIGKDQHNILFHTIDELIKNKGKNGIVYINDLEKEMVTYTINKLKKYILQKYPVNEIVLKPLVGDFFEIDIPKVTSIHLKNPEDWFFKSLFGKDESKKKRLEYFADHSKEGLTLVTYYTKYFLHGVNMLGVGYKVLNSNYLPYIHTDGSIITKMGNVMQFSIKSSNGLGGRLRSHTSTVVNNSLFSDGKRKREEESIICNDGDKNKRMKKY